MATYNTFKELAEHLGIDPEHPTVADQQKVRDWMSQNPEYEAGAVTNNYLNAKPGLFTYDQPPKDTVEPDTSNLNINVPGVNPEQLSQPAEQPAQPESEQPVNNARPAVESALNRGMQAWSPLAPSAFKGGDRSGFASGERAKSDIYTQNAAENAKILQWNKQRATDNTLADKVAAAQASGQWRQNANALGAEGGASVVASRNEAVTPDIMAQKQYQSQQMNTATQNLAEVNRNKLEANAAQQNASITDYNTQYNESRDAYAHNLATANNQQTTKESTPKDTNTKDTTTTPATTDKPDGKVESTDTVDNTQQAAAEVNQQSQATSDATNEVSEQQQLQDIADEINGIYNTVATLKKDAQQNAPQLRELKKRYDELKPQYDNLASKSKNPPPQASVPDFGMFDSKYSEIPSTILEGVNKRF